MAWMAYKHKQNGNQVQPISGAYDLHYCSVRETLKWIWKLLYQVL